MASVIEVLMRDPQGASRNSSGISDLPLVTGLSLGRGALKLDAALASNARLFDSDHLTAHER